ncbi:hypothetical protein MSG28_006220 [Choristoneura fumiferana]|uniref:Uncharacterized protein n=1 Tax=Choristoneura fumiferana TaxID=7141 RepID=A0ACC0JE52_CHOFU|nr:hypothetical protein MSG28_006220 [Choristoneura fumiferana]
MLEPWNDASLLPPPIHTFSCSRIAGIQELRSICKNIIKVLSKQSPLHKESAILSRFAYKFDKKFRNDIGYRNFKKVNVALRRYLLLNLLKDVVSFSDTLPPVDDEFYLPTRQMLQYVLVRLLAFSKIMLRICICSKKASVFYLDRIRSGDSHWMSLMPYAVLSRVWSMCSVLLRHACNWYSQLLPWLDKLQVQGVVLLPDGYNFPLDLEDWLDLKNFLTTLDLIGVEDEDGDNLGSILEFVNQVNDNNESEDMPKIPYFKSETQTPLSLSTQLLNTDQGEIISRENFKATANPKTKPESEVRQKIKYDHSPASVTNTNSLKDFIKIEETCRNENSESSLTSHLSFMQWQALKNALDSLLESLSNNRKIEKKFKKIWKEKCVDYS